MTEQVTTIRPVKKDLSPQENVEQKVWLKKFLEKQDSLVLATCQDNIPYCNLMSYVICPDGTALFMITPKTTVKYENMSQNRYVSVLIKDDHESVTFDKGSVVTISGIVAEISGQESMEAETLFISKYPQLEDFARSDETAVFRVYFKKAVIVRQFQFLTEITY